MNLVLEAGFVIFNIFNIVFFSLFFLIYDHNFVIGTYNNCRAFLGTDQSLIKKKNKNIISDNIVIGTYVCVTNRSKNKRKR